MKKIIFLLALIALAVSAQAQLKITKGIKTLPENKLITNKEVGTLDGIDTTKTIAAQFAEKVSSLNVDTVDIDAKIDSILTARFGNLAISGNDLLWTDTINGYIRTHTLTATMDSVIIPNWTGLKTNLVASYSFDETSGTTATNYITGGVGNGTITGATINQTGKVGKCYSFDGSGDYVVVADHDNLDLTDFWTVSFWATIQIPPTNVRSILSKNTYSFTVNNGVSDRMVYRTTSWVNTFVDATWYHFTFVNTNGQTTCYINKVSKGTNTITNPTANTDQLAIGAVYWTGGSQWIGKIDEVHIWKGRALSAAEVGLMYDLEVDGKNVSVW